MSGSATAASRHLADPRLIALAAGLLVAGAAGVDLVVTGSVPGPGATGDWLRAAATAGCAAVAAAAAALFCAAGSTTAGALAAVLAALVVVVDPGAAAPVASGLLLVAVGCGASPAWTRRETAAVAARSVPARGGATGPSDEVGRPCPPRRWNGERVAPAALVLLFPLALALLWVHTGP